MNILSNFQLKKHNTFGISAKAKNFVAVSNTKELASILQTHQDVFVLGGGSNMLLTQDIEKLVVHINFKGIEVIKENEDYAWVKAQAGENWHKFVLWCLKHNYGGLENLSLIPGN
ncbi:FAD-binding protein, partial [uncultured Flavobacterium sp.]|uniref:FAD-binding protein n=1 Tax=uncultured Flavobacterium sp. TaxID=165435 RepID=UPI0030CA2DC4